MYISKLSIQGYKNTQKKSTISFNKGLNVLLGENGCGKTAVINALRLLLREPESNYACSPDDFYCSLDRSCVSDTIEIDAVLSELTEDEKIIFLSWCNADFDAHLHLRITENPTKLGSMKRKYWGSESTASIFEEDRLQVVQKQFLICRCGNSLLKERRILCFMLSSVLYRPIRNITPVSLSAIAQIRAAFSLMCALRLMLLSLPYLPEQTPEYHPPCIPARGKSARCFPWKHTHFVLGA